MRGLRDKIRAFDSDDSLIVIKKEILKKPIIVDLQFKWNYNMNVMLIEHENRF